MDALAEGFKNVFNTARNALKYAIIPHTYWHFTVLDKKDRMMLYFSTADIL